MNPRARHFRRGYILPAVLLFLAAGFGMWVIMFRSSATLIRVEQARVLRDFRTTWTAAAAAQGLRLMESGDPPLDNYQCKLALTQEGQTKWFLLTYTKDNGQRWTLRTEPTTEDASYPVAPSSF
jgi:hypothetical protein